MAAIILGSGTTPVTGTREIDTDATLGTSYTFSNGLTESLESVVFGGALLANTIIHGSDIKSIAFGTNNVGTQVLNFDVWADGDVMIAAGGTGGFGALAKLNMTSNSVLLDIAGSGKGMQFDNDDMTFFDTQDSKGLIYAGDYSAGYVNRSIVDKEFVETVSEQVMHVAQGNVLYTNAATTTIVTVPADAVIWDVQVWVITGFTDSGTDLLDIGYTGTTNRFEAVLDISTTGFKTMTLTNVPSRVGATNITFTYTGQNGDAGAGSAMVYIHYSLH